MRVGALALVLLVGAGGCGAEDLQHIRLSLTPQSLDPSLIARVAVAALHDSSRRCVVGVGSNLCNEVQSTSEAEQADGYVNTITLTKADGSTAIFSDLPHGRACFVAEALSQGAQQLALGCTEVELRLDRHVVEIEVGGP